MGKHSLLRQVDAEIDAVKLTADYGPKKVVVAGQRVVVILDDDLRRLYVYRSQLVRDWKQENESPNKDDRRLKLLEDKFRIVQSYLISYLPRSCPLSGIHFRKDVKGNWVFVLIETKTSKPAVSEEDIVRELQPELEGEADVPGSGSIDLVGLPEGRLVEKKPPKVPEVDLVQIEDGTYPLNP